MTQQAHGNVIEPDDAAEEYVMPCAEALVAGTLALMTGHARCACAQHRDMMAKKAASNLHVLSQHPSMSEGLRAVAQKLHEQWTELIQATHAHPLAFSHTQMSSAEQSRALWHTTPEVIQ